jgi:hypothetical protein
MSNARKPKDFLPIGEDGIILMSEIAAIVPEPDFIETPEGAMENPYKSLIILKGHGKSIKSKKLPVSLVRNIKAYLNNKSD